MRQGDSYPEFSRASTISIFMVIFVFNLDPKHSTVMFMFVFNAEKLAAQLTPDVEAISFKATKFHLGTQ